jgi:hypothetical protein
MCPKPWPEDQDRRHPADPRPRQNAAGHTSASPSCASAASSATSPPRLSCRGQPSPILRLRYQGSADQRGIGIYRSSNESSTESELPTSFGPKTGTLEQGIDRTFILYAGPSRHPDPSGIKDTGTLRPAKLRNTSYR